MKLASAAVVLVVAAVVVFWRLRRATDPVPRIRSAGGV